MATFFVNKERVDIAAGVPGDTPLLWLLRDNLNLTGTKYGCGMALCGACTVYLDGQPTRSCVTPLSALKPGVEICAPVCVATALLCTCQPPAPRSEISLAPVSAGELGWMAAVVTGAAMLRADAAADGAA